MNTNNGKTNANGKKTAKGARNGQVLHGMTRRPSEHALVSRFGAILGKRFTHNNQDLLAQAHTAFSGLNRSKHAIRGRGANIFTQWVGDPDALGSAVVLKAILEHLGAKEVRILTGALGHPQNRNLVERCGITLHEPNADRLPRGLNCMVDTSPPLGMSNTNRVTPVREYFFVADHHAAREDVEANCKAHGVRRVRLGFVGLPVGSTSAFLAAMGFVFGVFDRLGPAGRAAVALGIYTDTSALLHGATALDFRMFEKLTRDPATQEVLDELRDYRVPLEWYQYRTAAFQNLESKGAVRVAPIGYVRQDFRDVVAEVANDLLRIEGTTIGIAVAVTEKGTEVSVRADSRLLGQQEQQRIVQVIDDLLGYAFPGRSGFKYERRPPHRVEGGAHVPHGEAEERMWKIAPTGGIADDVFLAHCRACAHAIFAALKDLEYARPDEIRGLL